MKKISWAVLVLTAIFTVGMAVLLMGVSTAKYTDSRMAYAGFGVSKFNVVILGENTLSALETGEGIKAFNTSLRTTDLLPGMTYNQDEGLNTAEVFPFSVANGSRMKNVSEASLEYYVRMRTTCNLPLKYSLRCGDEIYSAADPIMISPNNEEELVWYELRFYKNQPGSFENPGVLPEEAVFELSGGTLELDSYELLVEWPIEAAGAGVIASNSVVYMKEIELLEVRVVASSKNMITTTPPEDFSVDNYYGQGIIVLDEEAGAKQGGITRFTYTVDLRSYQPSNPNIFPLIVDNGVGKGLTTQQIRTNYTVKLLVPYNNLTKDLSFGLRYKDSNDAHQIDADGYNTLRIQNEVLLKFDELGTSASYGDYVILLDEPTEAEMDAYSYAGSQYRLYKLLTFCYNVGIDQNDNPILGDEAVMTLYNMETNVTGQNELIANYDYLQLTYSGSFVTDKTRETILNNKVKIWLDADLG